MNNVENIFNLVVDEDKRDYKCYDILKEKLQENENFREVVKEGILEGKITGFTSDLWDKIERQNFAIGGQVKNFIDYFKKGYNMGNCTATARQLSYSFNSFDLCGGVLPLLAGTINCNEGEHHWLCCGGDIYDTSLMLIIDEKFAKEKIGYQEVNRYDPSRNLMYKTRRDAVRGL